MNCEAVSWQPHIKLYDIDSVNPVRRGAGRAPSRSSLARGGPEQTDEGSSGAAVRVSPDNVGLSHTVRQNSGIT